MKHLKRTIAVRAGLTRDALKSACSTLSEAVTVGKFSQRSADKAEQFLSKPAPRPPQPLKQRLLLAAFYCLTWGYMVGVFAFSTYTRFFHR